MSNDISIDLLRQGVARQRSGSGRDVYLVWSLEDDVLIATNIAKYGLNFGSKCRDLPPHQGEEDCQIQVRYLSCRRCADNAVKRQVLILSISLNPAELQTVNEGVQRFGDASNREM